MSKNFISSDYNFEEKLKNLEYRIARIETLLSNKAIVYTENKVSNSVSKSDVRESSDSLEFNIGQFWFAKVGIVVLAIGIILLLTFPYKNLASYFPSLIGYVLVAIIIAFSIKLRKSYDYLSRYLYGGALLLLFFSTLRLHFFSAEPFIVDRTFEVVLLLIVTAFHILMSIRRKSIYLTSFGIILVFLTLMIGESAYFIFIMLTLLASLIVYYRIKFQWSSLFILGIFFTYLTHIMWFINNPLLGNRIQLVSSPNVNIYFLLLYLIIFSIGNLLRGKEFPESNTVILSSFLNCSLGYGVYLLITLLKFNYDLPFFHFIASIVFLSLAIFFWLREKSKYSTFFYAILGYTALSVAIISQFDKPDFFVWLCWQSLIVMSTAIWFRSKFIILANFVIFLLIFLSYLVIADEISFIALSFGIVALVSARVLNWKKNRLELKTELMRNSYLITAFFIFPYSLYHLIPKEYLVLSWIAVSITYYVLGNLLKNNKYSWMSIATLLLTVLYVMFVGLIDLEPVLRIISFLILGLVLVFISILYAKRRLQKTANESKQN